MATRKEASDKKKELSSQISALVRTLSLSVLAIAWLFLAGSKDAPSIVQLVPKSHMMGIGALCVLAVSLDLVQYIAGYYQVDADYQRAKRAKSKIVVYSDSKLRWFSFRAKILLCITAAMWLVIMLVVALVTNAKGDATKECEARSIIIFK